MCFSILWKNWRPKCLMTHVCTTDDWSPVLYAGAHICNVQVLKRILNMEILCWQPLDRNCWQLVAESLLLKMIILNQWARKVTIFYCCHLVDSLFWGRPAPALRRSHARMCLHKWTCDRGLGDGVGQTRFGNRSDITASSVWHTAVGAGSSGRSVSVNSWAVWVLKQLCWLQTWSSISAALHGAMWLYQLRKVLIQGYLYHAPLPRVNILGGNLVFSYACSHVSRGMKILVWPIHFSAGW